MPPDDQHQAIRAYIRRLGGHEPFAERHGVNVRTAQRIYSGKALCPPGILAEALGCPKCGAIGDEHCISSLGTPLPCWHDVRAAKEHAHG